MAWRWREPTRRLTPRKPVPLRSARPEKGTPRFGPRCLLAASRAANLQHPETDPATKHGASPARLGTAVVARGYFGAGGQGAPHDGLCRVVFPSDGHDWSWAFRLRGVAVVRLS